MQNRLRSWQPIFYLGVAGVCLVMLGLYLGVITGVDIVQATPPEQEPPPNLDAEYVSSNMCNMCHRPERDAWQVTAHAQTVKRPSEESILGDMTSKTALTIQWPDGDERPITVEDITYVLGGRYVQRYMSVLEDEDGTTHYYVLPVQWNIAQTADQESMWSPYRAEDWMEPARDWRVACAGCHTTNLDTTSTVSEADNFAFLDELGGDEVELGVGCEACHGPGSEHKGTKGTIVRTPDAAVCGQCHVQGQDPSGEHGYPVGYQPGLDLDDSMFELAPPEDESVWWPTGHARVFNQYGEWLASGHGQSHAMGESCAQCHGTAPDSTDPTPDEDTLAAGPVDGITCVACHNPHPVEEAGDALSDSYALCISCHNSTTPDGEIMQVGPTIHYPVQEMFEGLSVVDAVMGVPSGHFTAEDGPRCVDCHMPATVQIGEFGYEGSHSLAPVLSNGEYDGEFDSCTGCHTDLNPEYLQKFILDAQTGVSTRLTTANEAHQRTPDAPEWTKTVLDFVANDGSQGIHNYAYTNTLLNAVEVELGMVELNPAVSAAFIEVENPETCAACHGDEHQLWQTSPHAVASTSDVFLQEFAAQGRPNFCMSCHASGYDATTGQYLFEGVVCSNCHIVNSGAEHPPAPVDIADTPFDCGRCHSGAHAPTYDEWLVSDHKEAGIDCVDCHTPHNNGLILGDVNTTCGDCHQEAVVDDVHMGEDMTCIDCHLDRQFEPGGVTLQSTGHTMEIDPGTCAECHGNTHLLSVRETNHQQGPDQFQALEEEIEVLREDAKKDWNSGVVGGALGALVLVAILYLILRFRSLL